MMEIDFENLEPASDPALSSHAGDLALVRGGRPPQRERQKAEAQGLAASSSQAPIVPEAQLHLCHLFVLFF